MGLLGSGVVPVCPFYFRVPLLKPQSRKKGTLMTKIATQRPWLYSVYRGFRKVILGAVVVNRTRTVFGMQLCGFMLLCSKGRVAYQGWVPLFVTVQGSPRPCIISFWCSFLRFCLNPNSPPPPGFATLLAVGFGLSETSQTQSHT